MTFIDPKADITGTDIESSVEEAEKALKAAKSDYLAELEADTRRGEGSGRQERLREENQERLASKVRQCERDLEKAKQGN